MGTEGRELAPHQAAGRLLASLAGDPQALSQRGLASQTGLPVETIETALEWLGGLDLIQEDASHRHRLDEGRLRGHRDRFHLLLHIEPDPGVSSFCHVLLAESGYPSVGFEDSSIARRALDSVEFDLAVLCASNRSLTEYLEQEADLLRRLPPAPVILYGAEEIESPPFVDFVAASLPGPLRGDVLLAAVQALLPSERR